MRLLSFPQVLARIVHGAAAAKGEVDVLCASFEEAVPAELRAGGGKDPALRIKEIAERVGTGANARWMVRARTSSP